MPVDWVREAADASFLVSAALRWHTPLEYMKYRQFEYDLFSNLPGFPSQ